MLSLRKSQDRGHAEHGWLTSHHTFSFAGYHDPRFMGFRSLRVINEDFIKAGQGFGTHPHQDMEIITYVIRGSLSHKDSMGNHSTILPGEVQHMSAGTGVLHSEHSDPSTDTHLLQVWIMPNRAGVTPRYGQKSFAQQLDSGKMVLVASSDGKEGSLPIHQDAEVYAARPRAGVSFEYRPRHGQGVWVQVVSGSIVINGNALGPGDALSTPDGEALGFEVQKDGEFLLFDLA